MDCPSWCVVVHGPFDREHMSRSISLGGAGSGGIGAGEADFYLALSRRPGEQTRCYVGDGVDVGLELGLMDWARLCVRVPELVRLLAPGELWGDGR